MKKHCESEIQCSKKEKAVASRYKSMEPSENKSAGAEVCGDCNKAVRSNQNGLLCELCEEWFHIGCQKIPLAEYKIYKHEDCKAIWFCNKCNNKFKHL